MELTAEGAVASLKQGERIGPLVVSQTELGAGVIGVDTRDGRLVVVSTSREPASTNALLWGRKLPITWLGIEGGLRMAAQAWVPSVGLDMLLARARGAGGQMPAPIAAALEAGIARAGQPAWGQSARGEHGYVVNADGVVLHIDAWGAQSARTVAHYTQRLRDLSGHYQQSEPADAAELGGFVEALVGVEIEREREALEAVAITPTGAWPRTMGRGSETVPRGVPGGEAWRLEGALRAGEIIPNLNALVQVVFAEHSRLGRRVSLLELVADAGWDIGTAAVVEQALERKARGVAR